MKKLLILLFVKIAFLLATLSLKEVPLPQQALLLSEAAFLAISFCFFPRMLRWTLGTVLVVFHVLQFVNIFETGTLIHELTILNLPAAENDIAPSVLAKLAAAGIIYLMLWLPDLFAETRIQIKKKTALIAVVAASLYGNYLFSLPAYSFFKTLKSAYRNITFIPERNDGTDFLREDIVTSHNDDYRRFTFAVEKPNVVLLFAEGTSELVLSEKLTPNTMRFLNQSIRFTNYFNHTAATFRGIRGQMISGYQFVGGYYQNRTGVGQMTQAEIEQAFRDRVESLPMILAEHGYETIFCSPHSHKEHLAEMLKSTGFEKAYGSEEFGVTDRALSDKEQYERILQVFSQHRSDDRPLFLSAYIYGTHHGMDSEDIKYCDGSNSYLNKFHNQDVWFGRFLTELEKRGMLDDTVVIWTTDHATYPTPEFNSTFQVSKKYFVDRIPLGIYYQNMTPAVIDAKNRNSLSLAPTILDIVGIRHHRNHFLGRSLFSDEESPFIRISNIGSDFYLLENGVVTEKPQKEMPSDIIRSVNRYNGFSSSLF